MVLMAQWSSIPAEFCVLVDVTNADRGSLYPVVCDDDILSLYQFNISSANVQPTDRGMHAPRNTKDRRQF